jgi:hypothetical protein
MSRAVSGPPEEPTQDIVWAPVGEAQWLSAWSNLEPT